MSTSIPNGQADLQKCSTLSLIWEGTPNEAFRNIQLSFPPIIPLQTSYTRARISHIIRVKSKSIPYHAFSLSLSLSLSTPAGQGEREQSVGTWNQTSNLELTAWSLCLVAYLALLSSTHPQLLSRSRIPPANTSWQLIRYWLFTLKLPSVDESLWRNVLKDHLNAKVAHHFCHAKDWSRRFNGELKQITTARHLSIPHSLFRQQQKYPISSRSNVL